MTGECGVSGDGDIKTEIVFEVREGLGRELDGDFHGHRVVGEHKSLQRICAKRL